MHDEGSFAASIIGSSVKTLAAGIVDRHMSIEAHAADTSYGGQRTLAFKLAKRKPLDPTFSIRPLIDRYIDRYIETVTKSMFEGVSK